MVHLSFEERPVFAIIINCHLWEDCDRFKGNFLIHFFKKNVFLNLS